MKNTSKSGWIKHTNLDEQNKQIWTKTQANLDEKTRKSGWKNKQIWMKKNQANLNGKNKQIWTKKQANLDE